LLVVSAIIVAAPSRSPAPRARLPAMGCDFRTKCFFVSPMVALTVSSIDRARSLADAKRDEMIELPTLASPSPAVPIPSCRSTSQSGRTRSTIFQMAAASGPLGDSSGAEGKHRFRLPSSPAAAAPGPVDGIDRMTAAKAGRLACGRTISLPHAMVQCRISSAAPAPAGSLPCMPPTMRTVGPGLPLSIT
jgi:hypothetical protein